MRIRNITKKSNETILKYKQKCRVTKLDRKLVIKNLKNIKNLEFTIPSKKGVYLLTGGNEVGKTTLLVCLSMIGNKLDNSNTFRNNFKTNNDENLDSFTVPIKKCGV